LRGEYDHRWQKYQGVSAANANEVTLSIVFEPHRRDEPDFRAAPSPAAALPQRY